MVSKGASTYVLWPQYFDQSLSRAQGRRVPKALAVREPDAQWIETASRRLNLEPVLEEAARHPRLPYEKSGRVLVAKRLEGKAKEELVRLVGEKMKESQQARDDEREQQRARRRIR